MVQNFIYQNVSGFVSFFYIDVYIIGNDPKKSTAISATLMLIVSFIDVIWDPVIGVFLDKHNPKLGKYRSAFK